MSSPAAWIRWESRCRNMPAHGVTAGDTYYLGLRDYVEMYPCPNGLPIDHREPAEVPAWNNRVAKAKRDSEQHREQIAWQQLGEDSAVLFAADDVAGLINLVKGAFDVE